MSNCFFFFEPLKLYILFTSLTKSVIIELLFRLLVHFIYDDIEDSLEIVDYYINDKSMPCLIIKYKNKIDNIGIGSFYKGGLGRFLGKITSDFKIEIGTIIKDDKRNWTS